MGSTFSDHAEAELFKDYLKDRRVLICDSNAASRSSLFHVFKELGAPPTSLHLVNGFEQAQQDIITHKPEIVVTEFDLDRRCGLDLLQSVREQLPKETRDSLFLIVTSNTSQTAAARALEEEVDSYILKPYTLEQIRKVIIKTAVDKLQPNPYTLKIREGKDFLATGDLDQAEAAFNAAIPLSPAPALAYSFLGQIRALRQIMGEAQDKFQKGLEFNRIHYRCLVGLYDLLLKQQKNAEAYAIVRRIAKYFPANPKRMTEVLRLAVVTGQYEDIEKYYAIFTHMDERNSELILYTSAALIVCGKYFLSTKLGHIRAIELFRKAAIASPGRVKILKEIILSLVEYNLHAEAAEFLTRFPPEASDTDDFILMRFLIHSGAEDALGLVIDQGRALLAKGIESDRLFEVMIEKEIQAKHLQAAEDVLHRAKTVFPDKAERFERVAKVAKQKLQEKLSG